MVGGGIGQKLLRGVKDSETWVGVVLGTEGHFPCWGGRGAPFQTAPSGGRAA